MCEQCVPGPLLSFVGPGNEANYECAHYYYVIYLSYIHYVTDLLTDTGILLPRFRWHRSRWGRYCPVELAKGNMVLGRMEFAVGYVYYNND